MLQASHQDNHELEQRNWVHTSLQGFDITNISQDSFDNENHGWGDLQYAFHPGSLDHHAAWNRTENKSSVMSS